jgi:hypothetical protein
VRLLEAFAKSARSQSRFSGLIEIQQRHPPNTPEKTTAGAVTHPAAVFYTL